MNESNRQESPYSQQQRIGSVPVLFSLRNVQPSIVSGITQPNPNASTTVVSNGAASKHERTPIAATPIAATPTAALPVAATPISKSTPPTASNRTYNVAVGFLVIALCLLVIRNTQGSKTDSKETIAANTATSQMEVKPLANLQVELVPPALPKSTSLKPFDMDIASSPKPAPISPPLSTSTEIADSGAPGQLLVQDKLPMLLTSSAPSTTEEKVEPVKSSMVPGPQPDFSFPETRVAMNPNAMELKNSSPELVQTSPETSPNLSMDTTNAYRPTVGSLAPNDPASAEEGLAIVDTNSPPLTTRDIQGMYDTNELKEMYKRRNLTAPNPLNGQAYPRPDSERILPVSSVSIAAPVPNRSQAMPSSPPAATPGAYKPYYNADNAVKDPGVLSGRPYSTLPQDFPALTVPSYEREVPANRQYAQTAPSNTLPIRQPVSNEANRYYPSTTQTPYAPLPPSQDGASFGYPPGK